MTKQDYKKFSTEFFSSCMSLSDRKNADYTGNSEDPFANFTAVGDKWVLVGFYTRMTDKMMRIRSYIERGKFEVDDESIKDTLRDLANYSALMAGYMESEKQEEELPF